MDARWLNHGRQVKQNHGPAGLGGGVTWVQPQTQNEWVITYTTVMTVMVSIYQSCMQGAGAYRAGFRCSWAKVMWLYLHLPCQCHRVLWILHQFSTSNSSTLSRNRRGHLPWLSGWSTANQSFILLDMLKLKIIMILNLDLVRHACMHVVETHSHHAWSTYPCCSQETLSDRLQLVELLAVSSDSESGPNKADGPRPPKSHMFIMPNPGKGRLASA